MTPTLTRHTVRVNGIRMHVAEAGKGPPVVLLHGYPETWYAWRNQWLNLAQDYHVIMPDLRGYGDSDKPDSGYDKRTMAEDVRQLVAHFGYDRISLIGHDRGARVATRFANPSCLQLHRCKTSKTILVLLFSTGPASPRSFD